MAKKQEIDTTETGIEPVVEEPVVVTPLPASSGPLSSVRRLKVNRIYQGVRTQEQAILTGLYYEDDPALMGLAQYLVDNQYAEWSV